jgi:hypothetical protein
VRKALTEEEAQSGPAEMLKLRPLEDSQRLLPLIGGATDKAPYTVGKSQEML